jgi:hypothetical protein
MTLLTDRVGALLFLRGDIHPATGGVCIAVDKNRSLSGARHSLWSPIAYSFSNVLGLITRIGSLTGTPESVLASAPVAHSGVTAVVGNGPVEGKGLYTLDDNLLPNLVKDGVIPASSVDATGKRLVSETGQIKLDEEAGTLQVVTDRSECFVLPALGSADGNAVSVKNGKTFGSMYVIAVDGKPLTQSQRLLVMNLTDSSNTGMRFSDETHTKLEDYGKLPHLFRRGTADISMHVANPAKWKAWAVDTSGARQQEVPMQVVGDRLVLKAGLDDATGGSPVYELARSAD